MFFLNPIASKTLSRKLRFAFLPFLNRQKQQVPPRFIGRHRVQKNEGGAAEKVFDFFRPCPHCPHISAAVARYSPEKERIRNGETPEALYILQRERPHDKDFIKRGRVPLELLGCRS